MLHVLQLSVSMFPCVSKKVSQLFSFHPQFSDVASELPLVQFTQTHRSRPRFVHVRLLPTGATHLATARPAPTSPRGVGALGARWVDLSLSILNTLGVGLALPMASEAWKITSPGRRSTRTGAEWG